MKTTDPDVVKAYNVARDHLRAVGYAFLDYPLEVDPTQRYNIARAGEKDALALSESFAELARLAERDEG